MSKSKKSPITKKPVCTKDDSVFVIDDSSLRVPPYDPKAKKPTKTVGEGSKK